MSTLAPTVTVNEEVEPPTITVEINGKTAQANLPTAGGNGWEKLDVNDLPTDFSTDDLIIFVFNIRLDLDTTPSSWNTPPTDSPTTLPTGTYYATILVTGNGGSQMPLGTTSTTVGGSVRYIIVSDINFGSSVYTSYIKRLNNKSGVICSINATCFNGGGATKSSFDINYEDIPSRIVAMYRCKTN